jgi:hypothetical protein
MREKQSNKFKALGTSYQRLYKTDGHLGQIILTGNVLQRAINKLTA